MSVRKANIRALFDTTGQAQIHTLTNSRFVRLTAPLRAAMTRMRG